MFNKKQKLPLAKVGEWIDFKFKDGLFKKWMSRKVVKLYKSERGETQYELVDDANEPFNYFINHKDVEDIWRELAEESKPE